MLQYMQHEKFNLKRHVEIKYRIFVYFRNKNNKYFVVVRDDDGLISLICISNGSVNSVILDIALKFYRKTNIYIISQISLSSNNRVLLNLVLLVTFGINEFSRNFCKTVMKQNISYINKLLKQVKKCSFNEQLNNVKTFNPQFNTKENSCCSVKKLLSNAINIIYCTNYDSYILDYCTTVMRDICQNLKIDGLKEVIGTLSLSDCSNINDNGTIDSFIKIIAKSACAFLNRQVNGTIHFGIEDNGTVYGCKLVSKKKISKIVKAAFSRLTPSIPEKYYQLEFIPVYENNVHDGCRYVIQIRVNGVKNISNVYSFDGDRFIRLCASTRRLHDKDKQVLNSMRPISINFANMKIITIEAEQIFLNDEIDKLKLKALFAKLLIEMAKYGEFCKFQIRPFKCGNERKEILFQLFNEILFRMNRFLPNHKFNISDTTENRSDEDPSIIKNRKYSKFQNIGTEDECIEFKSYSSIANGVKKKKEKDICDQLRTIKNRSVELFVDTCMIKDRKYYIKLTQKEKMLFNNIKIDIEKETIQLK